MKHITGFLKGLLLIVPAACVNTPPPEQPLQNTPEKQKAISTDSPQNSDGLRVTSKGQNSLRFIQEACGSNRFEVYAPESDQEKHQVEAGVGINIGNDEEKISSYPYVRYRCLSR